MADFPNDATGDALRRFVQNGFDLNMPMEIDFFIAVPDQESGTKVALKAEKLGFKTKVEMDSETSEWTCYVTRVMIAKHSEITKTEQDLSDLAKPFNGYCDGFGSFGNIARS